MKQEKCYGIIPLRLNAREWQVLLIRHQAGHWSFPKGHANPEESLQQTAERELFEETGLKVQNYLLSRPIQENYQFTFQGESIYKTVNYFLALVQGEVILQKEEIQESRWLTFSEAHDYMTFKEGKELCQEIHMLLKSNAMQLFLMGNS